MASEKCAMPQPRNDYHSSQGSKNIRRMPRRKRENIDLDCFLSFEVTRIHKKFHVLPSG